MLGCSAVELNGNGNAGLQCCFSSDKQDLVGCSVGPVKASDRVWMQCRTSQS